MRTSQKRQKHLSSHSISLPFTPFLSLPLLLLLVSCTGKPVIDEKHTFDGRTWNRFTPEAFDMTVNNIEDYYNIDLTATVDTALYRYEQLPVMVILRSPGGEERQFYGAVLLKDKGRWRGQSQGGSRTATSRLRSYFSFNSRGHHHLDVNQTTSQYDLEGVQDITLTVTKAKVDYDL